MTMWTEHDVTPDQVTAALSGLSAHERKRIEGRLRNITEWWRSGKLGLEPDRGEPGKRPCGTGLIRAQAARCFAHRIEVLLRLLDRAGYVMTCGNGRVLESAEILARVKRILREGRIAHAQQWWSLFCFFELGKNDPEGRQQRISEQAQELLDRLEDEGIHLVCVGPKLVDE